MSVCSSLVDNTLLEENRKIAREVLLEETDTHKVKQELSERLVDRVLLEVVDSETRLLIQDTYRYPTSSYIISPLSWCMCSRLSNYIIIAYSLLCCTCS